MVWKLNRRRLVALLTCWCGVWGGVTFAADAPVSTDAVRQSMDRAKAYLFARRGADGWESSSAGLSKANPQGQNALVLYALLSAGESASDEKLQPIVEAVLSQRMVQTYEVAVRMLLSEYLKSDKRAIDVRRRDLGALLNGAGGGGGNGGMFRYSLAGPLKSGGYDHFHISTSNYGVLGVWAGAEAGLEVPQRFWEATNASWRAVQKPDGSWSYAYLPGSEQGQFNSSMSMTTAGLATLLIAGDYQPIGRTLQDDKNMSAALNWIDKNFDVIFSRDAGLLRSENAIHYSLYNLERIGTASGLRFIGSRDWFERGAAFLLATQKPDGSWVTDDTRSPILDTAFALLFLTHGSAPIAYTKLDPANAVASEPGAKNSTPRDVYNLIKWIGRETETRTGWQRLSLDAPQDALDDARVTFVTPSTRLNPDDAAQVAKLKAYVEGGGLILGACPANDKEFAAMFRKLGTKIVPGDEFRALPETHPIYTRQQYLRKTWKIKPDVLALSNGVRECMILTPTSDIARFWQQLNTAQRPDAFELAANIYLYSVSQDVRLRRGDNRPEQLDPKIAKKSDVRVARVQTAGNWNPEPLAWPRLGVNARNAGIEVVSSVVELKPGALDGFKLAHLTGTTIVTMTDLERVELKRFTDAGGLLLVDAAGGSGEFNFAVRAELEKIYGSDAQQLDKPLPIDHPIYGAGDAKVKSVSYRPFYNGEREPNQGPRLRGLTTGDRLRVVYSPEDLTAGWTGMLHDGIQGYNVDSARAVGRAVLGYVAAR